MTYVAWMRSSAATFLDVMDTLSDEQLQQPSGLPEWSRLQVIAHVHFNALALCRLLAWARTGTETRMYASREQRNAEIDGARDLSPAHVRELVRGSSEALLNDTERLDASSWQREVVTAQGRTVPASEIPWMRTREVVVHAVDLRAGHGFDDVPSDILGALAGDATRKHAGTDAGPGLVAWLTGRTNPSPELGRWL